jgi:hypothetical protein
MSAPGIALVAVLAGLLCGWLNVHVLAFTWGKVASGGKPKTFVLSSFLRVGACAIVAGVFAAVGPWWSMALYLVALFVPFVLYAAGMSTRPNE